MAKSFRYADRSDTDYESRANQSIGDYESFIKSEYKLYKPHDGDNYIRFLPPTFEDPKHYGIDVWVHYGIGPEEASIICLQKMRREPCPICEARIVADRRGDTAMADDLKPNRRVLVWLLDMKEAARDRRPLLWAMGGATDLDFTKQAKDRETGTWRRVDHPDDGLNVSFERTGTLKKTRYSAFQFSNKPSSVPDDDLDYIMDNPLPDCLRWRTYEEIGELFDGGARAKPRGDDRGRDRGREPERERPREDARPSNREPERDRPREEDRPRDRERDREPVRDRPREDDREQDRPRDRERDRPREDDRPRDRDRGREPEPERDAPRTAESTAEALKRRWSTDAPREDDRPRDRDAAPDDRGDRREPSRDRPRDETSDAPRRERRT